MDKSLTEAINNYIDDRLSAIYSRTAAKTDHQELLDQVVEMQRKLVGLLPSKHQGLVQELDDVLTRIHGIEAVDIYKSAFEDGSVLSRRFLYRSD